MPGPFDLDDERAYRDWRDGKLSGVSNRLEVIELRDPRNLEATEREALLAGCARSNMAIYRSPATQEDKDIPRLLGRQLGLERLDGNFLADVDGISSITPGAGTRGEFIPYTDRAIGWHTDGYYNPACMPVRAMILHCVRPAPSGGETALLDPELAWLRLRQDGEGPRGPIPMREDHGAVIERAPHRLVHAVARPEGAVGEADLAPAQLPAARQARRVQPRRGAIARGRVERGIALAEGGDGAAGIVQRDQFVVNRGDASIVSHTSISSAAQIVQGEKKRGCGLVMLVRN